jgi:hypothetical protein
LGSSNDFYSSLKSFSDFHELDEAHHFSVVPADWYVIICDIRGSTKAIEEGRYQDVNTIGAASIAAVQNVWPGTEIPFVFGGDGATLLVPEERIELVKIQLLRLKNFSKSNYGMDLRVGAVRVGEIEGGGSKVEVAKFAMAKKKTIALIRGGGLTWAESKIKGDPQRYCWETNVQDEMSELKGLSCRWEPLQSAKGSIVSLIVKPRSMEAGVLREIMENLSHIIDGDFNSANPVKPTSMKYKTLGKVAATERKYLKSFLSIVAFKRIVSILVSMLLFRIRIPSSAGIRNYVDQIPAHSDYRKFDDVLRMVLDCSHDQVRAIETYLRSLEQRKLIYYGLHESDHALMTCLVENLGDGGHIHFIDGGAGGYAMAAKSLKMQMSAV